MNRNQHVLIIVLTLAVATVLTVFIGSTINSVNEHIRQACFKELDNAAQQLADNLYRTTDMDRTVLEAMAHIIASSEDATDAELAAIMKSYSSESSYVNYVELLKPNNTMLGTDGLVRDVSGFFDFEEDAARGTFVTDIRRSSLDPTEKVIRNVVPVVKNGETIYILYGVVRLSDFTKSFTSNTYDGNAYIYVLDGSTGDFILDTWHKSLGNIADVSNRTMLPGYSFETARANMAEGVGGHIAFVSTTTGGVLYMAYRPIGVNNWSVVLTVEEGYVFAENAQVMAELYTMAAVIGVVVLFYMACVVTLLVLAYRRIRKIGLSDQVTNLQNRNAYDEYRAENEGHRYNALTCVFVDVNGLHEVNNEQGHQAGDQLLKGVSTALLSEFRHQDLYRVGGDEFVALVDDIDLAFTETKMQRVTTLVEARGASIAYGISHRPNEVGTTRVTREADEAMLRSKRAYYEAHDRRGR